MARIYGRQQRMPESTTPNQAPPTEWRRGRPIPPQGVDGYDQNWYPVCLSSELAADRIHYTEFLDGHVIVFRDEAGAARVTSPYCRHFGANLRHGTVRNGKVICPFHAYTYDGGGRCVATGVGDAPPAGARLVSFPVFEHLGVVWAFNGERPLYEPPGTALEGRLVSRTTFEHTNPVDHTIMLANSVDTHHLRVVHGLNVGEIQNPEFLPFGLRFEQQFTIPGAGGFLQNVHLQGTNAIVLNWVFAGLRSFAIIGIKALPGNRSMVCATTGLVLEDGVSDTSPEIQGRLEFDHARLKKMIGEDDDIFNNCSFRVDCLTEYDALNRWYFDYVDAYPRSAFASQMISAA